MNARFLKIYKINNKLFYNFIVLQAIISIYSILVLANLFLLKSLLDAFESKTKIIDIDFFFIKFEFLSINELAFYFTFTFILSSLISIISLRAVVVFSQKVGQNLKSSVFQKYVQMPYQSFLGNSSSDIQTLISVEIQRATSQIIQPVVMLIYRLIPVIFILVYLCFLNLKLSLITILSLVFIIIIFIMFFRKKLKSTDKSINDTHHNISKNVFEVFKNFKQIKVFRLENLFFKFFEKDTSKLIKVIPVQRVIELTLKSFLEILAILLFVFLVLYISNVGFENIDIAAIITFFFGMYRILPGLQTIYSTIISLKGNIESLKFLDIINNDDINNFLKVKDNLEKEKSKKKILIKKNFNNIKIKNLYFSHNKNIIFNNISFSFIKNKIYCIKGESGVGKTTLIDLVSGLIEAKNAQYCIDQKELSYKEYSHIINDVSYCGQDSMLFNSSILYNITFEKDMNQIDKNKLDKIIDITGLKQILSKLPNHLEEIIFENGANLSGGQKQRIGLARCFYKNFSILILDEATSALDKKSEKEIFEKMIKYFKNKGLITLFISHSNDLDKYADDILILKR